MRGPEVPVSTTACVSHPHCTCRGGMGQLRPCTCGTGHSWATRRAEHWNVPSLPQAATPPQCRPLEETRTVTRRRPIGRFRESMLPESEEGLRAPRALPLQAWTRTCTPRRARLHCRADRAPKTAMGSLSHAFLLKASDVKWVSFTNKTILFFF